MADNDFDFGDEETDAPKQKTPGQKMREQLEAALQEKKELAERLAALEERERKSSINDLFKQLKVDEKYHKLYSGDADESAIKSWAEEFGFLPAEGQAATQANQDSQQLPPGAADAMRIQQTAAQSFTPDDSLLAQLNDPNKTIEDMVKAGQIRIVNYS